MLFNYGANVRNYSELTKKNLTFFSDLYKKKE